MINVGSTIVYGSQVCKVSDLSDKTFGKITRKYYVLMPVFDEKNMIYVPVDNEKLVARMKQILSAEEIYALIAEMPDKKSIWIDDDKLRAVKYKELIENGNREEIITLIKTLFEHKCEMEARGRKLHASDEIILARAEKVIYEEFALVLNIKRDEVVPFIAAKINVEKK